MTDLLKSMTLNPREALTASFYKFCISFISQMDTSCLISTHNFIINSSIHLLLILYGLSHQEVPSTINAFLTKENLHRFPLSFLANNQNLSLWGFAVGTSGKEPTCQWKRCKRLRFHPWVGKIPWRRNWQPTPVFLPGKSHGQRSLAGYSPGISKEWDTTKHMSAHSMPTS